MSHSPSFLYPFVPFQPFPLQQLVLPRLCFFFFPCKHVEHINREGSALAAWAGGGDDGEVILSMAAVISTVPTCKLSRFVPCSHCSTALWRYFDAASAQKIRQLCITASLAGGDAPHGRGWLLQRLPAPQRFVLSLRGSQNLC